MEIFFTPEKKENLSIVLGFFDGIHKGHKKVIEKAVQYAKLNGLKSAVISFKEHPSCLLFDRNPEYILSYKDRINEIEKLGIDYLYLLNFTKELSQISKGDYFNFLRNFTSPKAITTGFNHYFGKNKEGNTDFLNNMCTQNKIFYQKIEPVKIKNLVVSSSSIRKALQCANLDVAKKMLGYNFFIKGNIVHGKQIGKKLGYRTINIEYPSKIIQIPFGVYCTNVTIDEKTYNAVSNWGVQPTFGSGNNPVIEAHILNFCENIYGRNAKITFLKKIRDEKKFDTLCDLQKQIKRDIEFFENYINT